jgi:predicted amidohydrolase
MHQVAAIQMCSSTKVEDNLNTAEQLIKQAAKQGAILVVLPEMFVLFGENEQDTVDIKEHYGSGKIQDFISNVAQKYNVWIVAGTIPISCDNPNKIRAACIVYNHLGTQVARYDKIHLFDVTLSPTESYKESNITESGNELIVVDSPVGRLGLCVCFDLRFPNHFEQLNRKGIDLIAVPSAFTLKTGEAHWKLLSRSRAIDTFSYVIGSCQGGTHTNGRKTYGHSLIVNPWGEVMKEIEAPGNGLILAEINLDYLHKIREQIPTLD